MSQRSYVAEFFLILAVMVAFTDESVRKALPSTPIYVTTVKQVLVLAAGALVVLRGMPGIGKFLVLFLPWTAFTLVSGLGVASQFDSPRALPAVIATYSAAPLLFAVGYYLGMQPVSLPRLARVFLVATVVAALVAVAQEYVRPLLPMFLQARIYKEGHVEAGGAYNESLFASPQILAQVMFPMLAWCVVGLMVRRTSRGGFWAAAGVILCAYTIYLTRIRVAVALAAVTVLFILLLIRKTGLSMSRMAIRVIAGAFALSLLAALLIAALPNDDLNALKGRRDERFFSKLLDPSESLTRLMFWQNEISDLPDHNWIVGYGAGTGGSMRTVIDDPRLLTIPVINDTGIALLYHELGLVGCVVFALAYVGIPFWALFEILRRRRVDATAIASLGVYLAFLVWFLAKSHPVIGNAFSHIVWLGMLGLCVGTLKRATFEEHLPQSWHDDHGFDLSVEYDPAERPLVTEAAAAADSVFAPGAADERIYRGEF